MARRIRIPGLLDLLIVDDPDEMATLNRHPDIARTISGQGGLLHRVLHGRIYGTLRAGGEPLPAFAGRDSAPRAARQTALETSLARYDVRAAPIKSDIERLARYVATGTAEVPIGVSVQQLVGRLFRPGYMATPATYEAARVINEWPRANPVKAAWWQASGKLARSKRFLWERAGQDPACIHATAIAFHNMVAAIEKLRTTAIRAGTRNLSVHDAVRGSLVAPPAVLRSATGPVRAPFLKRPLRTGTLVLFKLGAMHERSHDPTIAFATGEWNQCPGHDVVPRLLAAIWTTAMSLKGD